jgi:hypothetical protein
VADHVEGVRRRFETLLRRQFVDHSRDRRLEGGARRHVDDPSAGRADQVVVMVGEVLGELEARELVAGGDAPHHAGALEVGEVAVGRAARHVGDVVGDVGDAGRVAQGGEQFDDRLAPGGVALVHAAQMDFDQFVQIVDRRGSGHPLSFAVVRGQCSGLGCNETHSHSTLWT